MEGRREAARPWSVMRSSDTSTLCSLSQPVAFGSM
jgi:hypothetical protein